MRVHKNFILSSLDFKNKMKKLNEMTAKKIKGADFAHSIKSILL